MLKATPKFKKSVYVNLDKKQLHELIDKYTTGFFPHVVLSIEPSSTFAKFTREYSTVFTVIVFASQFSATIADIIAEFKKLLVYHRPMK